MLRPKSAADAVLSVTQQPNSSTRFVARAEWFVFFICGLTWVVVIGCGGSESAPEPMPMLRDPNAAGAASPGGGATGLPMGSGGATPGATSSGGAGGSEGGASPGNSATGGASKGGGAMNTAGSSNSESDGGMSAGGTNTAGTASGGSDETPPDLPNKVLLYYKSALDIPSVHEQMDLLEAKLTDWGFESVRSDDPAVFTAPNLAEFGGVAMINTCFEPFGDGSGEPEAAVLKGFVESGGGLFGTHCGAVTYQTANPPHPYNELIGGRGGDGFFNGQSDCRTEGEHVTIAQLPAVWSYTGDLDNADYVADDSTVLVRCKWSANGQRDVAVSWIREPGEGRVFFSNFAKTDADLRDGMLDTQHLFPGLAWVLRK